MVGDEYSDPAIMNYLGARKTTMLGNNLWVLSISHCHNLGRKDGDIQTSEPRKNGVVVVQVEPEQDIGCCSVVWEQTSRADRTQNREVLSLRICHKCFWEINQGVEGIITNTILAHWAEVSCVCSHSWQFTEWVWHFTSEKKNKLCAPCSSEYHVDEPPRLVLDKLEKIGFRMVTMTGVGQTLVWCMHKETEWPDCGSMTLIVCLGPQGGGGGSVLCPMRSQS